MGLAESIARARSGVVLESLASVRPHLLGHVHDLPFPSVPLLVGLPSEPSLIGDEYNGVACK
jgi:hypothetical protein